MAKQGENREETKRVKHLYRVWSQVDSKIELPTSLTARALLPKLDHVEQPVAPIGKIRFSPKIFTWQSGVTYAAAFALILMLSSVLTRHDRSADLLHGEIAAAPGSVQEEVVDKVNDMPEIAMEGEEAFLQTPAEAEQGVGAFAARVEADEAADEVGETGGIGGQSESMLLGKDEIFTYMWRTNDPTDPDKQGFPVTVNIVETNSGELAATIDVPDMLTVRDYYLYNDIIAFVGADENSAMLYAWDITDKENPQQYVDLEQQGVIVDANLYNNMLHLLTVAETADGLDCEIVPLPGSASEACCVVTVVDLGTKEVSSKAFSGINAGEISLFNLHAYINYDGDVTETNQTGKYVAQIRLDGINIELAKGFEQEAEQSQQSTSEAESDAAWEQSEEESPQP